jgi:AbrB family looped-hinge helix DNA binding protein
MITTIDAAGRIVVPKEVRRQARLTPGATIEIRCRHGIVEIEPAPLLVAFRRRGRLVVAEPGTTVPALTSAEVEDTRRRVRRERGTE